MVFEINYEKACVSAILLRCQELAARLRVLRTAVKQRSTGPDASAAASPFSGAASSDSGDHESNVDDRSPLSNSLTLAMVVGNNNNNNNNNYSNK